MISKILDSIKTGNDGDIIYFVIRGIIFLVIFIILGFIYYKLCFKYSEKVVFKIKERIFSNLSVMDISQYQGEENSFFYNMLTHDIDEIEKNYISKKGDIIVNLATFIISLIALFYIDWIMAIAFKVIFNNFSYTFKKGNSYLIIGESGSGKSTIAKLISGFFSDFEGDIKYNGVSYKDINKNTIYNKIRYLGTNVYVIDEGVAENIRLYRNYTNEEVIQVGKKVGFDKDFILKESLGDSAKFISSGEYQRISMARCMIEKPYCMILDEPTANLDLDNRKKVQEIIVNLDSEIKIVISHNYDDEFLSKFDYIIDMNNIKDTININS